MAFRVLVDPPVVDQPDRYRVQVMELLPSRPARNNESRGFKDFQVLHDAEARHLQLRCQLRERAAVTRKE